MSDAPAAAFSTDNGAPTVEDNQVEEIGHKVFAGNLAYSTTDEGLKTFFAGVVSEIISATVIMRGSRSAGYGFVALHTLEAAENAVAALDKKELDGRQIIVEVAKPADQKDKEKKEKKLKRRVGRRGGKAATGEVTEAEAEAEANGNASEAPAAGGTDEVDKPRKKKKGPRKPRARRGNGNGRAWTVPVAAEGEEATVDPQPARTVRPRKPRVPRPPRPSGEDPVGEPSENMLFVANLGFNIDEDGLQTLFTDAGINVITARVVRRSYGKPRKSKGYGFVDVGNEAEQKKAIAALDDKEFEGRKIAVKVAVNTPHEDTAGFEDTQADGAEAPAAAA